MRVMIMQTKFIVVELDKEITDFIGVNFDKFDFEKFEWEKEIGNYVITDESGNEIYER